MVYTILNYILILLFGLYGLYLYFTENITNYVNQRFFEFSFYASLLTVTYAVCSIVYLLFNHRRDLAQILHNPPEGLKSFEKIGTVVCLVLLGLTVNSAILLVAALVCFVLLRGSEVKISKWYILPVLTLLLGFGLEPQNLTSITAAQREGDFNTVSLTGSTSLQTFTNPKNYEIGDWIASFSFNPDYYFYKGKEVNVTGFVFAKSDLPEELFAVARFVVTCCSVDARPVGLNVRYANWKSELNQDEWVRVSGKFEIEELNEQDTLVVRAEKIERVDEPVNPYIY